MKTFEQFLIGSLNEGFLDSFNIDWTRKPKALKDVHTIFRPVGKAKEFIDKLESINVEEKNSNKVWEIQLNTSKQYHVLNYDGNRYLVDNQGYNYPRYVVKLL